MTVMKIQPTFLRVAVALALALVFAQAKSQNCVTQVAAGPDTILCAPGTVPLSAQITGASTSVQWTPATGVANPNTANTTVNATASATYTVTVRSLSPTNLIINGDFSQGNTGFTSDYQLGTSGSLGPLTQEGRYVVVNDAGATHTQFADCNDHTTGNGLMMVVNASGVTNDVWCQTITVNPNTDYDFSAWVTSVTSQNPARLQFSINGVLLGSPFNAISATCQWRQFMAQWNSGNTVSAEICIVNVNLTPAGNDFALDDISFREICVAADSTVVQVAQLNAAFTAPAAICQNAAPADPNTWLAAGATPGGQWTVDGQPFTSFNPADLAPGAHQIVYEVTLGACNRQTTQSINIAAPPSAGPAVPEQRICQGVTGVLNLFGLMTGATSGGQWQDISATPAGSAFNAANANLTLAGLAVGAYRFRYTVAGQAGCPDAQNEIVVTVNPNPVAQAGPDAVIDCNQPTTQLTAQGTGDPNLRYTWTLDGQPLHNGSTTNWTADAPGLYTLRVENTLTGCSAQDDVTVASLIATVSANLSITPAGCLDPNSGIIAVNAPSGGTQPYMYALNSGAFGGDPSFENLPPGAYTITVQDAAGCQTSLEGELPSPAQFTVTLTAPNDLIELGESVRLSVLATLDPGLIDTILWSPALPDCAGCNSALVAPNETTRYTAIVRDANGCTATDSITIRVVFLGRAYLPTAFSPNDDGVNDRLFVQAGPALERVTVMRIMNRWGGAVYERADLPPNEPSVGWDGKAQGEPAPSGAYVYYAELRWTNGETTQISGHITLVR